MTKINRSILIEIFPSVIVGVIIFTLIVITQQLIRISDYIIAGGMPPLEIGKLILYSLPAFLEISIPISLILGVTITFSRLSIDSELVALKSSGVSTKQLLSPVVVTSLACFFAVLYLTLYGAAAGYNNLYATVRKISYYGSREIIKEGVFIKLTETTLIYVDHLSPDGSSMNGIMVSEKKNFDEPVIITAHNGERILPRNKGEGGLLLRNGVMDQKISANDSHHVVNFENLTFNIDSAGGNASLRSRKSKEMSVPEIFQTIRDEDISENRLTDLLFSLHRRLSLPFACIVFAFLAVPLGAVQKSRGKSSSFIITGIIVFLYYLFLGVAKSLKNYSLALSIGILWSPNIIFGLVTILFFMKMERDPSFTDKFGRLIGRKS